MSGPGASGALKRKTPHSPHGSSGGPSPVVVLDKKLLPRIHDYLDSLDPNVSNITPTSIVEYLRRTYAEYQRKPVKGFQRTVEQLCEKMRKEAVEQAEQEEHHMQDVQPAAGDVVIISSSVTPSSAAGGISFAPLDRLNSQQGQTSVLSSPSSATGGVDGRDKKRRKLDGGDGAGASGAISVGSSSGNEAGQSEDEDASEEDQDVIDLDFVEAEDKNLVNSSMRNLYNRAASLVTTAGGEDVPASASQQHQPYQPNPQKPRERKSKEKVVYTQNSKKPQSAKKKANAAKVTNVHFQTSNAGPDDIGGGDGSNWHPEVLHPTSSYADLGGIEGILQEIHELVEYPLQHPEIYRHLGIQPPRGVLLHGPPGCGKTMLAHAIAGELGVPFMKISAPEVVSGMSGESEQKIRTLFADALENAPCLLFIDEIDAITPKRATAQREMERRIVAQLLTCMDSLSTSSSGDPNKIVIVIGATNRPDALDAALRRAGRFDREIALGIPDEAARARILQVMCRSMKLEPGIDWPRIAKAAVGYVGADLMALTREAAVIAINRIFRTVLPTPSLRPMDSSKAMDGNLPPLLLASGSSSPKLGAQIPPIAAAVPSAVAAQITASLTGAAAVSATVSTITVGPDGKQTSSVAHLIPDQKSANALAELNSRGKASQKLRAQVEPLTEEQLAPLFISHADFELALKKVQPSSKREGFATIPDVTWNDIGALDDLREELSMTILQPILNPMQFESIGLTVPAGVLLFGPPGCGKTLVAKAIANESGASFLSIKGPELLNQYVGQSERAVRKVFQRARASAPCVIFFDELDALVPKRGSGTSEGNNVSERVVNQLLTEMDGLEERRFVFVIAATNRPDIIDPAMLRPGRLDKLLYVKLPTATERAAILRKHLRRTPLSSDVDVLAIASDSRAEGFSGADVAALVREATLQALREAQAKQREELLAKGVKPTDASTWSSMKAVSAASSSSPSIGATVAAQAAQAPLPVLVGMSHFAFAFSKVFPSVSPASRAKYDRMHRALSRARSTLTNENPAAGLAAGKDATIVIEEDDEKDPQPPSVAASSSITAARFSPSLTAQQSMPPPPPKAPSHPVAAVPSFTQTGGLGTIFSSIALATAKPPTHDTSANMDTR